MLVNLSKDEMSTILYVLEGYVQGNDDEELLEYSLHKTQYIDYKSGDAKKKLTEEINLKKELNNSSKEERPIKMTKILTISNPQFNYNSCANH